jgi:hypothetical protein
MKAAKAAKKIVPSHSDFGLGTCNDHGRVLAVYHDSARFLERAVPPKDPAGVT